MDQYSELTGTVIGAAMEVHSYWGPGLIESIYEKSLAHELAPIHEAQLMTYMKLTNCKVGLLINFNVVKLKEGIRRLSLPKEFS